MRISDWSSDVCSSDLLQHATGFVDRHFFVGVEPAGHRHFDRLAVLAMNDQRQRRARLALADDVKGFGAVDVQRQARGARLELQRRSEEHTSELQSLMRTSYAAFGLKKTNNRITHNNNNLRS